MKPSKWSTPPIGTPEEEDARFAEFLAELRSHAHEATDKGDQSRELLADDPDAVREAWQLGRLWSDPDSAPIVFPPLALTAAAMACVLTGLLLAWVLR